MQLEQTRLAPGTYGSYDKAYLPSGYVPNDPYGKQNDVRGLIEVEREYPQLAVMIHLPYGLLPRNTKQRAYPGFPRQALILFENGRLFAQCVSVKVVKLRLPT